MRATFNPLSKIQFCTQCGASIIYGVKDVNEIGEIICPNCGKKQESLFNFKWNGDAKNDNREISEER